MDNSIRSDGSSERVMGEAEKRGSMSEARVTSRTVRSRCSVGSNEPMQPRSRFFPAQNVVNAPPNRPSTARIVPESDDRPARWSVAVCRASRRR